MFLLKHFVSSSIHLGHPSSLWNPRLSFFLFGLRDGLHIFDLEQSIFMLRRALSFVSHVVSRRGFLLFLSSSSFSSRLRPFLKRHSFLLPEVILLFSHSSLLFLKDALKLQIPVISVLDSNSNPFGIHFPIPGNDHSLDSLLFYSDLFSNAILHARRLELSLFSPSSSPLS